MSDCKNCGEFVYDIGGTECMQQGFCSLTCQYMWEDAAKRRCTTIPPKDPLEEYSSAPPSSRFGNILPPSGKPTNPKDMIGSDKLPVHLWPETATALGCLGLLDGALKYGRGNFRAIGVRASIYVDAAKRHLNAWFEGEDIDAEEDGGSGLPHLAHALATIAILVDAQAAGKLTDDRNFPGGYRALVQELTPHVKRLKEKHADKAPKHYTIGSDT